MFVKLTKLGLVVIGSVALLVSICIDVALLPIRLLINFINIIRMRLNGERSMHELVAECLREQFTCLSRAKAVWKQVFKAIMHLEELTEDDEAK